MWKDISTHSKSDEKRIPVSWEFSCKGIRVVVSRHIHHNPDVWLLSCEPFLNLYELKNKDIDAAKEESIKIVTKCLENALQSLKGA